MKGLKLAVAILALGTIAISPKADAQPANKGRSQSSCGIAFCDAQHYEKTPPVHKLGCVHLKLFFFLSKGDLFA